MGRVPCHHRSIHSPLPISFNEFICSECRGFFALFYSRIKSKELYYYYQKCHQFLLSLILYWFICFRQMHFNAICGGLSFEFPSFSFDSLVHNFTVNFCLRCEPVLRNYYILAYFFLSLHSNKTLENNSILPLFPFFCVFAGGTLSTIRPVSKKK